MAPREVYTDAPSPHFAPAPVTIPQSIFEGFGNNWQWASVDYRGVARVHTFEPQFGPQGRIIMPAFKATSEPAPAFDISPVLRGWQPVKVSRVVGPQYATDRFGNILPTGADPVEAADVVQAPTMASLNLVPVPFVGILTGAVMKYPVGSAVDIDSFNTGVWDTGGTVVGLDGPLYVVRRNGSYAGFKESELRNTPTEAEQFHAKVCVLLGWDIDFPGAIDNSKKLFDAGCRL